MGFFNWIKNSLPSDFVILYFCLSGDQNLLFDQECISKPLQTFVSYLIFVIFSPHTQFLVKFFSTQKRVNHKKTNLRQKCANCNKTNFTTKSMNFTHLEAFSSSHISYIWRNFRFLHIFHGEKSEITPHVEKYETTPHVETL